ncbi:hypothetical protein [Cohnella boryungensis]|uniref:Uncharacterized protein n=1 Tax=Cohnella boryungensis TaxID=768479 RepID=A0ABV8SDH8_9BACL
METYDLARLAIAQHSQSWSLSFSKARLMIVSDHGTRQWYIEIDGINDADLLHRFAESEHIDVRMKATTIGGKELEGQGFFHPNPRHRAAAIRGDGQLAGYEAP